MVVVDDAKYRAFALGNEFEPNIDAPYRGVFCNDCWSKVVVHSYKLHDEVVNDAEV